MWAGAGGTRHVVFPGRSGHFARSTRLWRAILKRLIAVVALLTLLGAWFAPTAGAQSTTTTTAPAAGSPLQPAVDGLANGLNQLEPVLGQLAPVTGQLNPAITQLLTGIQPLVDQLQALLAQAQ